jgi:hypothetical protein
VYKAQVRYGKVGAKRDYLGLGCCSIHRRFPVLLEEICQCILDLTTIETMHIRIRCLLDGHPVYFEVREITARMFFAPVDHAQVPEGTLSMEYGRGSEWESLPGSFGHPRGCFCSLSCGCWWDLGSAGQHCPCGDHSGHLLDRAHRHWHWGIEGPMAARQIKINALKRESNYSGLGAWISSTARETDAAESLKWCL